ncbi:MAG: 3-phosphoshikimate 1-carboxyvinyltransferase [Legionellales bacterium]|nr:3-phosphoshikimate 1-carboxyvinyltransferase [Legionellales bacterium]|tara:strand:- start:324 stop:1649 length:1326 start_codon:yes stop_codon:yes gene_type:complete
MPNHILINKKIRKFKKEIEVSTDKSLSIRTVLLASQAVGKSKISNLLESEDVINTLKAIKKLGIKYEKKGKIYEIQGFGLNGFSPKKNTIIDAGNSGTLGRLILGLLVKSNKKIKLVGDKSLSKRDFSRITKPLNLFGANIKSKKNSLPIEIEGTDFLRPINYLEKIGSAQVKSAIILAAMNTPGKTIIKALKSRDHTERMLKYLKLPIKIKTKKKYDLIEINGLKQFDAFEYIIPGDISSSAFFIVLTLLSTNSELIIKNVNINESRIGIIKILNKMNAKIIFRNKKLYKGEKTANIHVKSVKNLKSVNCPSSLNSSAIDEFLLIFLVAAKAKGVSVFKNLSELNMKESPRLDIATRFLKMIGIKVLRKKDNIKIYGNPNLNLKKKYLLRNFLKDHRVFMMGCVAALTLGGFWRINDKNSINTSFPKFLKILKKLKAEIN